MKLLGTLALLVAAAWQVAIAAGSGAAEAQTPIARVVKLLQGLQTKLEGDVKAEEEIFENYRCWYKSIADGKSASNVQAQSRIDSLASYIEDINAGRIEFTTERQDLEKQIATLAEDLQTAEDARNNDNSDFEAAKAEMEKAITALDEAITALQAGMSTSFLRRLRTARMLSVRWGLKKALEFGKDTLTSGDSKLIEDMLHGDVPTPDWKKLNRKATFKTKYQAASGDIVNTLLKLNNTFTENLEEAVEKEATALSNYNKLKTSKDTMLSTAQQALIEMVEENGARGLSRDEAQAEHDALVQQVADDTAFINQTEASYVTKKTEWEERKRLRDMEIGHISQALAVLHSDDARDAFTKAYGSASFLQEASVSSRKTAVHALEALRALAARSKDVRVRSLATLVASSRSGARSIAAVLTQIDNLISTLEAGESTDLTNKESCETQLAETAQEARMTSLAIDDLTDDIGRAKDKIEEVIAQIKEEEESIVEMNNTLLELLRQREDEHARYQADKADDLIAVQLIAQAEEVISKLHGNFSAMAVKSTVRTGASLPKPAAAPTVATAGLAAVRAHVQHAATAASSQAAAKAQQRGTATATGAVTAKQPVEVEAGVAPPPPPATWENPAYTGASGETGGIASILSLIKENLEADITAADVDEADSVAAYGASKLELDNAIGAARTAISDYEGDKATHEQTVTEKTGERTGKKTELDATMTEIKALKPGCDFILVNYEVRLKARQAEIDGLKEAKAILQGADFS